MSTETADTSQVDGEGESRTHSPEDARRELEEQFNLQRARMKELFLQKEVDLQQLIEEKEQFQSEILGLRAEVQQLQILSANQRSEIQNLQLLVSETVEASSSGNEEVRRLRARNMMLEEQLTQLAQQLSHQEVSLAPGAIVRTLARKLGADTEVDKEPPRKNVEDDELSQSLIEPLEMEITALKNKLRETDTKLQESLKTISTCTCKTSAGSAGDSKLETDNTNRHCDMCANYEKQLVSEQAIANAQREKANKVEHALKLATEELEGVRSIHDETIRQWQSERTATAATLAQLQEAVQEAGAQLQARLQEAGQREQEALESVTVLTVEREELQKKLDTLERDNAMLLGQYTKRAAEMQNEIINLPDNVTELQEVTLRVSDELIQCAIGRERALQAEERLRAQLQQTSDQRTALQDQLTSTRKQLEELQAEREEMKEIGDKLRQSNDSMEQLLEDKKRLQAEVLELRSRVSALQQELDNSEKVQRDFVRLSQSLQVQLQRIRESDTEVRWQHEEDVSECPACRAALLTHKKKVHCRHCGRIFCAQCVCHAVSTGPRGAPARVCSVCATLLQPHRAPYFSTAPPDSPH